ncbi:NDK3 kinase, partial [Atractosteus spatula]|nr:NDK3 kinase [Atractosteus spatula]
GRTPVVSDAIMICLVLTIFANIFQTAWAGINERTFIAVKPDGVQRRLVGEITRRFEQKGFRLVGLKLVQANTSIQSYWGLSSSRGVHSSALSAHGTREHHPLNYRGSIPAILDTFKKKASESLLKEHYRDLRDEPFFRGLIRYMSSGPVVAMVWQGLDVVKTARKMLGETNPADSLPGTIRGDYCVEVGRYDSGGLGDLLARPACSLPSVRTTALL